MQRKNRTRGLEEIFQISRDAPKRVRGAYAASRVVFGVPPNMFPASLELARGEARIHLGTCSAYVVSFFRIILNVHPPRTAVNRKRIARCKRTSVTEPRPQAVI